MLSPREFKGLRTIPGYPESLKTLGNHIRAIRLDRKEFQKDVANFIGVAVDTILHWELDQTEVAVRSYPKVMEYLRYCPVPERTDKPTRGELVYLYRIHRGLTLREAAVEIGVDPGALSNWERGTTKPMATSVAKLTRFIQDTGK